MSKLKYINKMAPHKEDWDFYRSYDRSRSRSRSSSPVPIKHHIGWPPEFNNKRSIMINYRIVDITEEQRQEINKMKLKQNEEIKKAIREAFLDSEDGLTDEDVDKIKENFADDLDEFIKSIIKV